MMKWKDISNAVEKEIKYGVHVPKAVGGTRLVTGVRNSRIYMQIGVKTKAEKYVTKDMIKYAYDKIKSGKQFTSTALKSKFPREYKQGHCVFSMTGGILEFLGVAKYVRGSGYTSMSNERPNMEVNGSSCSYPDKLSRNRSYQEFLLSRIMIPASIVILVLHLAFSVNGQFILLFVLASIILIFVPIHTSSKWKKVKSILEVRLLEILLLFVIAGLVISAGSDQIRISNEKELTSQLPSGDYKFILLLCALVT